MDEVRDQVCVCGFGLANGNHWQGSSLFYVGAESGAPQRGVLLLPSHGGWRIVNQRHPMRLGAAGEFLSNFDTFTNQAIGYFIQAINDIAHNMIHVALCGDQGRGKPEDITMGHRTSDDAPLQGRR